MEISPEDDLLTMHIPGRRLTRCPDTFFYSDRLTSMQSAGNSATTELLDGMARLLAQAGAPPDLQSAGALHYLGRMVYTQASTLAFRDCFMIVTVVFLLSLIPAWLMRTRRTR